MAAKYDYSAFYERESHHYDTSRYGSIYGRLFGSLHRDAIVQAAYATGAKRVLEVACGTGHITLALRSGGLEVHGVDRSSAMISIARTRLQADSGACFTLSDALCLPFPNGVAELIVSTRFLHLFPADIQANFLKEMHRVLAPGGYLIVDFDNLTSRVIWALPILLYNVCYWGRLNPDSHYNLIRSSVARMETLGLQVQRVTPVGGLHLFWPALLSRRLANRLGKSRGWLARLFCEDFVILARKP